MRFLRVVSLLAFVSAGTLIPAQAAWSCLSAFTVEESEYFVYRTRESAKAAVEARVWKKAFETCGDETPERLGEMRWVEDEEAWKVTASATFMCGY